MQKEPETIEWIDGFAPGETLWDIGANVGIYSIYAGMKGIRTFAFEPHFANYHQLCVHVALNDLQDHVSPLCLALADRKAVGVINLASIEYGTSMSSFGESVDFRGVPYVPAFRQGMIGYDIDSFVRDFGMEVPNHLKIDVDGIELAIVAGAEKTLADPALRSVSIELIETDLGQVSAVTAIMARAGLELVHKKHNIAFATPNTRDVLNYLFRKPATVSAEPEDPAVDEIVDCIRSGIAAAQTDPEPSENIFMENVFPEDIYQEMLERLPADDMLDDIVHPEAVAPDGRITRRLLDLTDESLTRLDPQDRAFWRKMMAVFTAPAITDAIVEKFGSTLRARFGDARPEMVAVPIFYRDYAGYRIGIHPDIGTKVATLQFYLPADESQSHLGTSFHRRTPSGFERLKTNSFRPNTAYAFVRTDQSWHSVDQLADHEKARNSIALTIYLKGKQYRSKPAASVSAPAAPAPAPATATATAEEQELSRALRMLASTFTRREDVAQLVREGGVGIELGVAAGDFSERVLTTSKLGYLYSVDMWAGDRGHGVDQYKEAIARLAPYRDRNAILRMRFDEALSLFGDHSLDFIYADGYAHNGEEGGQTFQDWYPKLRSGGIIAGGDYDPHWPLVVKAVNAFTATHGLELHVVKCREDNGKSRFPTWFALKP
ncbi:MAG TPA: FkbM family methyltransferase [Sphingomonas sp.]